MQIINNIFTIKSDKYNNPERAQFYQKHNILLTFIAGVSGAAGLYMALSLNLFSFFVLMVMSILGLSYNQKIIPEFISKSKKRRIKDIPGSKTILIAAAWGIVTSILPAISDPGGVSFLPASIFAAGLVFARTAFFDILEIQGDKIAGKETLPILIGEKKSIKLIKLILVSLSLLLVFTAGMGIVDKCGFPIALVPILMLYYIHRNEKGDIRSGARLEFIVESHFIIAGVLAAIG